MAKESILSRIDPELVIQESMYGIIMALTLVLTAQMGIVHYDSRLDLILAIIGMDFVWGAIDMLIFYRCDILARYRRMQTCEVIQKLGAHDERASALDKEFEDTLLDFVSEEDRKKILDDLADCKFTDKIDVRASNRHYLLNASAAFVVNFMGVIPSVLCLWLVSSYSDALIGSAVLSSVALLFVGYFLAPTHSVRLRLFWGITTAGMALLFTVFAAYFGG